MCAQPLWRALKDSGLRSKSVEQPVIQGVAFAHWAATTARFDGHDLVIAIDAATHLTVVFRLEPRAWFRRQFAGALAAILEDLNAPGLARILETSVIDTAPILRLTDRTLAATLKSVRFFCDLEIEYHDDLRVVQRNLNEAPVGNPVAGNAVEAVAELFARQRVSAHRH